jgi:HK97 family phage portal protein
MGLLSRSLGIEALSMEDPTQPLIPAGALFESLGLGRSDAGVMVNEKQAMRVTTAYGCINVVQQDCGSLPRTIIQKMPDGTEREAQEHRCYPIIHDRPNEHMTPAVFWGTLLANVLGWGNAYAFIKRDRAARVVSLHPMGADKTSPVFVDGNFGFATTQTADGQSDFIDAENVLHIPGLTLNGYVGLSPIQTCKNAFGLSLAAEKFGAQFFGNGARATGVLTHPEHLDSEAYENLKKSVDEWATGERALRPIILEEGLKWEQITINPNDGQFLETRKFQRSEIAALYRVPLHLLQELERSTNNNIEHQSLDYVRYCLKPWAVRIEQEVNRKLLGGNFYCDTNMSDAMRGDFASQTTGFQTLRNIGVYSANDIKRKLRENPIPAEEGGDVRYVQGANVALKSLLSSPAEPAPLAEADAALGETASAANPHVFHAFRRVFRDAVGRIANRKNPDAEFAYAALRPAIGAMAEAILAMEIGSSTLTDKDEKTIGSMARAFAEQREAWNAKNASETATALTQTAYTALKKELIG